LHGALFGSPEARSGPHTEKMRLPAQRAQLLMF